MNGDDVDIYSEFNRKAPKNNPHGGQNNYAPISNPIFTGGVTIGNSGQITENGNGGISLPTDTSIIMNGDDVDIYSEFNRKAPKNNPILTGNVDMDGATSVTAPTPLNNNVPTAVSTTQYVENKISNKMSYRAISFYGSDDPGLGVGDSDGQFYLKGSLNTGGDLFVRAGGSWVSATPVGIYSFIDIDLGDEYYYVKSYNSNSLNRIITSNGPEISNANLTGDTTAITQQSFDNSIKVATTAFVKNQFVTLVGSLSSNPPFGTQGDKYHNTVTKKIYECFEDEDTIFWVEFRGEEEGYDADRFIYLLRGGMYAYSYTTGLKRIGHSLIDTTVYIIDSISNTINLSWEEYYPGQIILVLDDKVDGKWKLIKVNDTLTGYTTLKYASIDEIYTTSSGADRYVFGPENDSIYMIVTADPITGNTYTKSVVPFSNNSFNLGTASLRWKEVFATNGTINTSDAREKTDVRQFTENEINAAKQLSKEIGIYKFLDAVESKGDNARFHIGMTVQRAIEIMQSNGLDPFKYGFICYDSWDQETKITPASELIPAYDEEIVKVVKDSVTGEKSIVKEIIHHEEIPASPESVEIVKEAGDIYSFRYTELLTFISKGFEARLSALENA